ncbi:MAG: MarR family winged helix-turn-helix transcriptional regulator [Maritimibacter harenae]|jgi:DNA-binding MarR family transcriptional regulator|nr:MarR family transcriptional regulator [Maritimibacter harenae]
MAETETKARNGMAAQAMPGHVIRRLQQRSAQVFHKRMQEEGHDLTSVQFAALDALSAHPGIDQAQLSALIAYDRATIGGVVDRLEQKGLVSRQVNPRDRRARVLALTPAGQERYATLLPVVAALQRDILGRLDPDEYAAFMALAAKAVGLDAPDAD